MENTQLRNTLVTKRDCNYDCLRVFAMCMVILQHVADYFVEELLYGPKIALWSQGELVYIFETISHSAVPLFLMLTGVYVIDKAGKIPPKDFYLSSAKKLGIPFIIFVVIYYVYDICIAKTKTTAVIWPEISTGFKGIYAHWYMVMLISIYAFMPLLAFIKNRVSYETWTKGTIAFFIWAMIGSLSENISTTWSLSNMYLISYVLIGNVIHRKTKDLQLKSNLPGIAFIAGGLLILILNGFLLNQVVENTRDYFYKYLNSQAAPLRILGSIAIFTGFSMLRVKINVALLSSISYIVFLLHKLIIADLVERVYPILEQKLNYQILPLIVVEFFIIFVLSIFFGYIVYQLLNGAFYKKIIQNFRSHKHHT